MKDVLCSSLNILKYFYCSVFIILVKFNSAEGKKVTHGETSQKMMFRVKFSFLILSVCVEAEQIKVQPKLLALSLQLLPTSEMCSYGCLSDLKQMQSNLGEVEQPQEPEKENKRNK